MAPLRLATSLSLVAGAVALDVTPIEKVIKLLDGMKKEVEKDGRDEAASYENFACFCKKTTKAKSSSITKGNDKIESLSADIADKTQEKKEDSTELVDRQQQQEASQRKLEETKVRCAKQKAEYEAEAADLDKAIQGLKDAIKSMKDSKPSLLSIKQKLGKTFAMAEAMNFISTPKHKKVAALLQQSTGVDPNDPEYKFHSNDIVDVCEQLLVDYKDSKNTLDDEWKKTKKGCEEMQASLNKKISANKAAMSALRKNIAKLEKEIATHREDLVSAQGVLKDDDLYLKDLTARCEDRANDYDQRSSMRNDELTALTSALKILKGTVSQADKVNVRAMLLQHAVPKVFKPSIADHEVAAPTTKKVALLQEVLSHSQSRSFLGLSEDDKKQKALDVLRTEGQRIGSIALTSLSDRAAADPFKKVKGLIQKLIERLLAESAAEATKKGFCDTELASARKDRDFRFQEAKDLSAELAGLEAKRDSLQEEIKQLKYEIKEESAALKETTKERKEEKETNMETLKTAKEGFEAVSEALLILRSFYKQAAKAAFVQASPVDEDTDGAGFSGNYKGNQSGAKAIFALLETISSDFDRTIRKTEEAEETAHREYVAFNQAAQSSIAGKTTKKELDEQDLKTTLTSIDTKTDDMQTAVDLLDSALETLEDLKPTCIDTGMSYSQRVAKREEEIKALQRAVKILAPQ